MSIAGIELASLQELRKLTTWFETQGTTLTVIGGWAVYALVPGHVGSKDIDLVGPPIESQLLVGYMENNGYTRFLRDELGLEVEYRKGTEWGDILLDWASYDEPNRFKVDRDAMLPYGLCSRADLVLLEQISSGGNGEFQIHVPTRELLLLYKVKAYTDRVYVLENDPPRERDLLEGKAAKDVSDIVALLDPSTGGVRYGEVSEITAEFSLDFLFERIAAIPEESLGRQGIERSGRAGERAKHWLQDLARALS